VAPVWPVEAGARYLVDHKNDLLRKPVKWEATSRRLTETEYQLDLSDCDFQRPLMYQFAVFQPIRNNPMFLAGRS